MSLSVKLFNFLSLCTRRTRISIDLSASKGSSAICAEAAQIVWQAHVGEHGTNQMFRRNVGSGMLFCTLGFWLGRSLPFCFNVKHLYRLRITKCVNVLAIVNAEPRAHTASGSEICLQTSRNSKKGGSMATFSRLRISTIVTGRAFSAMDRRRTHIVL